jgi:peptidoglycan hydrolase CwlO-like protein
MSLLRRLLPARPVVVVSTASECGRRCVDDLIAINVRLSETEAANRELYEENAELHEEIARMSGELEKAKAPQRPAPQPFAAPWPRTAAQIIAQQAANLAALQARLTTAEDDLVATQTARADAERALRVRPPVPASVGSRL